MFAFSFSTDEEDLREFTKQSHDKLYQQNSNPCDNE